MSGITLHAFEHSVYSWIARLALAEKGVDYAYREVNPFADPLPDGYLDLHPFRRVPVLEHNGFQLHETAAILRYLDAAFPEPPLVPTQPAQVGRMTQIQSIIDSYGYWPLVREVFSHAFYRPLVGEAPDPQVIAAGLEKSDTVLRTLENLMEEGTDFLVGDALSLADLHAFPMIDYFATTEAGRDMLRAYPRLNNWFEVLCERPTVVSTRPTF